MFTGTLCLHHSCQLFDICMAAKCYLGHQVLASETTTLSKQFCSVHLMQINVNICNCENICRSNQSPSQLINVTWYTCDKSLSPPSTCTSLLQPFFYFCLQHGIYTLTSLLYHDLIRNVTSPVCTCTFTCISFISHVQCHL